MTNRPCSERLAVALLGAALALGGPAHAFGQTKGQGAGQGAGQAGKGKVAGTPNEMIKGKAVVAEGDLLTINGTAIRLMGIDAPDPGQKCKNRYGHELDCFKVATAVLANLVKDEEVTCTVAEKDRTGEMKGECRVRGADLGAAMVMRGWAFQYASLSAAYQKAEAYAQSKRLGLWAGQVEKPWQWRSRQMREKVR